MASVRWHAVDRSSDGLRVRLAPHLAPDALRARLDEAVGPDAWSLTLAAWGQDALIAQLTLAGADQPAAASGAAASRAAVCRALTLPALSGPEGAGSVSAADAVTGAAWTAAAGTFGVTVPVVLLDDGWVDADPESGEGLHLPEHAAAPQAEGGAGARRETPDRVGADRPEHDRAAAPQAPSRPSSQAPTAAHDGETAKPDGHQVIDRLVERLREEGLGADAARLVTSYGGYGGDPEASRELYAKLRALLVQRSART